MGKISGSNLIIKCLKAEGVETIFGIAGDHFLHLLDEMIEARASSLIRRPINVLRPPDAVRRRVCPH